MMMESSGAPRFGSHRVRRSLFVERSRWQLPVFISVIAALAMWPTYENDSVWLGPAVVLIMLIGWHSMVVGRTMPWVPGLGLATAALQWVIAPWISYHIGPSFQSYAMAVPASEYFAYAVPALAMLTVGMLGVLRRAGRNAPPVAGKGVIGDRRFRSTCDAMVVIGIVTQLAVAPLLAGTSLAFVGLLISNLAFVGALALLLARAPGWRVRALGVLLVQALVAASSGMFHDMILWIAYFCLTLIYVYRLRARTIAVIIAVGMAFVMVLNIAKREFRQTLETSQTGLLGSAAKLGSTMAENAGDPALAYEGSGFKFNVTRLNQGWIISRVLYWVPNREPYAEGETIAATIRATLLPRVLDPSKLAVGGQTYFERFTGVVLRGTSMDLSVAGETYANFGYWGGLAGVFIFGAFIGMVYRLFLRWGYHSRLWWAWAPFVLLYSTKAEDGIATVTNLVAKSAVVMVAVIWLVPAWAMLRPQVRARLVRALKLPKARVAQGAPGPGR